MPTLRCAVVADDTSAAKRVLRSQMLDLRRAIASEPGAEARAADVRAQLRAVLAARFDGVLGSSRPTSDRGGPERSRLRRVLAYDAVAGEIELGPLLDELRSDGVDVVVPAATPDAQVPVSPAWADVIVVPGVAFDAAGGRLGRGGGWYDRLLADPARRGLAIGVAFEPQLVESVPVEEHDARLDAVVTERFVRWSGTR